MTIQTARRSLLPVEDAWEAGINGLRAFGRTEDKAIRSLSSFTNYQQRILQEAKEDATK